MWSLLRFFEIFDDTVDHTSFVSNSEDSFWSLSEDLCWAHWGDDGIAIFPPHYTAITSKRGSIEDGQHLSVEGAATFFSYSMTL